MTGIRTWKSMGRIKNKGKGDKLAESNEQENTQSEKDDKPVTVCTYPELLKDGLCVKIGNACACMSV